MKEDRKFLLIELVRIVDSKHFKEQMKKEHNWEESDYQEILDQFFFYLHYWEDGGPYID